MPAAPARFEQTWRLMCPYTMVKHARYIASLKLAQQVENVPGDVVECGVWRGGMIAGIAHTLGNNRHYWLFDSFEGLPPADPLLDGRKATTFTGKCCADERYAKQAMTLAGVDNYTLVKGWFADTLPAFDNNIALLRLDGDWYESTTTALKYLYPQVNPGGITIIDDYYYWPGCRQAVLDYLAEHNISDTVQQVGIRRGEQVAFIKKGGTS